MNGSRILVVDDEPGMRDSLTRLLQKWGYNVRTASSAEEALAIADVEQPALVLTDLVLPKMDGIGLLKRLQQTSPRPVVLILTGHATVTTAVEAMRQGAFHYLTKPVDPLELQVLLEKSLEQASLAREVDVLRHQLRQKGAFGRLIGQSNEMQKAYGWIDVAANSTAPVFIHGESGTGKELVARTIHERSMRRERPFVAINCAAIPETLMESEIFGHERGAFTGALERRSGCFELADGGTLLLDEIAEMNTAVQAKLLRILQDGTFRRVGGSKESRVDVRVIAATNRAPEAALAAGTLREDLFYRLSVFVISLSPLRDRRDDIVPLAHRFIEEFNVEHQRQVVGLSADAEEALLRHTWPGNVRELRNVVQRAVVMTQGPLLTAEHLTPTLPIESRQPTPTRRAAPEVTSIREMERRLIIEALKRTREDKTRAAVELGISPKTLYNKLARYKIRAAKDVRKT